MQGHFVQKASIASISHFIGQRMLRKGNKKSFQKTTKNLIFFIKKNLNNQFIY